MISKLSAAIALLFGVLFVFLSVSNGHAMLVSHDSMCISGSLLIAGSIISLGLGDRPNLR